MNTSPVRRTKNSLEQLSGRTITNHPLPENYFRIRDFEYVQPLYDLAFLLEVRALAEGTEVPKYRTFSLWKAGYSLDGYGTTVDQWLDGAFGDEDLDYIPSARIRQYLTKIRQTGTIPELNLFKTEQFERCLRLRSVRGLGPSKIALTISSHSLDEDWFNQTAINLTLQGDRINELYRGGNLGPWQTAHIVPPMLRFLNRLQHYCGDTLAWDVSGLVDPFEAVIKPIRLAANVDWEALFKAIGKALRRERFFRRDPRLQGKGILIRHQMGWSFCICPADERITTRSISELAGWLDPFASDIGSGILSDLHLHTAWSDGSASVNSMATAAVARGLKYFAVTDHSRTSKLQGGLTPILWLRQANALSLANPVCPVLHGIEVDILRDGTLDLPQALLRAADFVVASVHSSWTDDAGKNTDRLLKAIETGSIDVLAHPTSALMGKPGVPDFVREPADLNWDEIFDRCALWRVAVEMNCFPSRLDLPLNLLKKAIAAGCAISLGSDAHARSHLLNLRFGEAALRRLNAPTVLNRFTYDNIRSWIAESREKRLNLKRTTLGFGQAELPFAPPFDPVRPCLRARIQPPQNIPDGCCVVGIDLTAGDKATGIALLKGSSVETCSLRSDEEILAYIAQHGPGIVSIDSPLGLPGGGDEIDPKAGIVRVAEYDLASVGIPAYPALIDSMRLLTQRGIRLRQAIEGSPMAPQVIESYPGAAQDILCIPRKQKSLDLLREGLRRLGLGGEGLETRSHDEMDAITSAIVGRYFEASLFEPMGVPREAQLIVPKVPPLLFENNPIICLAGKTGAGKSVVARFLSVFYGFEWVRTRNIIRDLLIDDIDAAPQKRLFSRQVDPNNIREEDLREFGAVVLDVHKQAPLRNRLTQMIKGLNKPVIVDSIRHTVDIDHDVLSRPIVTWFVDCADSLIRQRLSGKKKLEEKRLRGSSPVDYTAALIREDATSVIPNSGSLEDLRWRIEDTLFSMLSLRN